MPNKTRHLYEFGPYRLDPDHRLLLRENRPVSLQPKAFDILLVLIEKSENVVLKDDLLKAVWPDTFVEESNLAQNIFVLRKTLGDAVGENRYIVTVPGRGYRFAEKVQVVREDDEEDSLVVETHTRSRVVIQESGPLPALPAHRSRQRIFVVLATVLGLVVAIALAFYLRRPTKLAEQDTVVLADFTNRTGDPVFDDTLKTALAIALDQSPFLNTLSDNRVRRSLQLMSRPADTKITSDVAREICQRSSGKAYIAGSIVQLGTQYVLTLEALNCQSGDSMGQEQVPAASKEKVLDALGDAASKLRSRLGESLATVQKFDAALPQATTPSLDALKAYSIGAKFFYRRDLASAPAYFQRALELDPNFAMAYVQLGLSYYSLGEPGRARKCFAEAFSLQQHTSEREKMEINALYYAYATGELYKAIHALQQQVEIYKGSTAYNALSDLYTRVGQYENSADAAGKLLSHDPSGQFGYGNLALDDLALQNFSGARQAVQQAQARGVDNYFLHMYLYTASFLQADAGGMAEQQKWFASHSDYENYGLALTADTEAYFGHLNKARELTKLAADSAVRSDNKENAAMYRADAALQEAAYGNATEARQSAAEALRLVPGNPNVAVQAALAFAMTGETTQVQNLVQELEKRFPLDTQMQLLGLPAIQAQLELGRHEPDRALKTLQAGLPVEFANATFSTNNTSCLYPTYIRGQAYLAAGQASAAAGEFQKILDHSGIVWNCWTGALAHLGLARAHSLISDATKAKAEYEEFFSLWKDADHDIPVYKQAQGEYAKLK